MRERLEKHLPMVYRLAWALTGNEADAQDLAHDTMVLALTSIGRFRAESSLPTWLTAILVNRHRSWRRSRAVRARALPPSDATAQEPAREAQRSEERDALLEAVQRLEEEERLIVVLGIYQGMSSSEIGRLLGSPPGTIRSRLHDIREKLRGWLLEKRPHE